MPKCSLCKQEGHTKGNRAFHPLVKAPVKEVPKAPVKVLPKAPLKIPQKPKDEPTLAPKVSSPASTKKIVMPAVIILNEYVAPDWYTIPEIPFNPFLELLQPIYKRMDVTTESKSEEDPLFRMVFQASQGMSDEDYEKFLKQMQMTKRLQMAMGDFHQHLMGLFDGWDDYKQGHETKCDIGKTDGTIVCEIKNNINTMNSDSLRSVNQKLQKQKELGKEARVIIVNGSIQRKEKDGIIWMSGKDFYEEQSGRDNFMQSLQTTMRHIFSTYNNYNDLLTSLTVV